MLADLTDALGRNIDALAYVALIIVLVAVAIHADKRYTQERKHNERLVRRIQSLSLVVRFQQSLVDAKLPEVQPTPADELDPDEIPDLSVDGYITQLRYCLTCHRLRAPSHFTTTQHLQLEEPQLQDNDN